MDVWAWGAGTAFTVIAVALWLASRWTDRLALRIFALRYGLAALGWFFAHPRAADKGTLLRFPSVVLGLSLIVLTLLALDVYLGRFRLRRLALQATLALLACLRLRWGADQAPDDPRGLFAVFALGMAWCAALAFAAARRERNAGHLIIAGAFASYPAVLVLATLAAPRLPPLELSYLVAVPTAVAGVAVLLASPIGFRAGSKWSWRRAQPPRTRCASSKHRLKREWPSAPPSCSVWCMASRASRAACRMTCAARWQASRALHLLANALRFARAASDRPAVRVGADHTPGHVTYFVADNGPGIPAGRERELFRPFSRLHGATLSHNGIGLSIVQAIIDKHRGRMWAERAPGGGAVFRFELDALAGNAQAA